jgi:hypothetical protein
MKTRYILLLPPLAACAAQGDGPTQYGYSPDSTCDRFLECVSTLDPEGLSCPVEEFGNDSPCWSGTKAEAAACSQACAAQMVELGACGCTTLSGCAKAPPPVGSNFNCLETYDGVKLCLAYTNVDEGFAAIASQSCTENGASYPSTCPTAGAMGTCSFDADGTTGTEVYYAGGGITAADAESACEMNGGTWLGE